VNVKPNELLNQQMKEEIQDESERRRTQVEVNKQGAAADYLSNEASKIVLNLDKKIESPLSSVNQDKQSLQSSIEKHNSYQKTQKSSATKKRDSTKKQDPPVLQQ